MTLQEYYDPATRWGRDFGYRPPKGEPNPYTNGYHRGQDVRKVHESGNYSVVTDVVAISPGTVTHHYTKTVTGNEIAIDTGRKVGRYEIHCHTVERAPIGRKVGSGQKVARNASRDQKPGTGWTAPHDHIVISDWPDAAHNTTRPVYDPRPFIRDALTAAAANDSRPLEDDMPITEHDARLIARTLLEWESPGLEESSGGPIPRETIARRLRVIRAHTNGLPARLQAQNAALLAAVKALAEAKQLDPAQVTAAIDKSVKEALDGWTLTINRPEPADAD